MCEFLLLIQALVFFLLCVYQVACAILRHTLVAIHTYICVASQHISPAFPVAVALAGVLAVRILNVFPPMSIGAVGVIPVPTATFPRKNVLTIEAFPRVAVFEPPPIAAFPMTI